MNHSSIPVIDIERLTTPATLSRLDEACRDWGFFQVVNHGIEQAVADLLLSASRRFFGQAMPAKRAVLRTPENPWGYFDRELTRNTRDWKEIYDVGPASGSDIAPQWPRDLPGFRAAVSTFYRRCETLARGLLSAVSINLGMGPEHLGRYFGAGQTSFLRLNHYPPCDDPADPEGLDPASSGHLGVNPHTDAGALTLLLQDDQPGLEVFRGGRWHLVEPRRGALVINIGDLVQVWSNDRYRASLHRVAANSAAERYSAPFFFNPAYDCNVAPLPSTVGAGGARRFGTVNWGHFRARRAAGDYADLGEEIQIDHYRVREGEANDIHIDRSAR